MRRRQSKMTDDSEEEVDETDGSEDEDDLPVHVLFMDHGPSCVQCGIKEESNPQKEAMLICDYLVGKNKKCDVGWHMGRVGLKRMPPCMRGGSAQSMPSSWM